MPRFLSLLLLTAICTAARAADPAQPPSPPPCWPAHNFESFINPAPNIHPDPATTRLVEDLASSDFQTRERATADLTAKGPDAFPGLAQALESTNDPEALARAEQSLNLFSFHLPPTFPKAAQDTIRAYQSNRASLAKSLPRAATPDPFIPGLVSNSESSELFFRTVLPHETDPILHNQLTRFATNRAPLAARLAIAQGNLDLAQHILAQALPTDESARKEYAALVALRNASHFDPDRELAQLHLQNDLNYQMAILLYRAAGDTSHAADFAATALTAYAGAPVNAVLLEAARFEDLASRPEQSDGLALATFDFLTTQRFTTLPTNNADRLIIYQRLDRAADAITISQQSKDPQNTAAHLLLQQLRLPESLKSIAPALAPPLTPRTKSKVAPDPRTPPISFVTQLSDLGLTDTAQQILDQIKLTSPTDGTFGVHLEFQCALEFDRLGNPDKATAIRNVIFDQLDIQASRAAPLREKLAELQTISDNLADQLAQLQSGVPSKPTDHTIANGTKSLTAEQARINLLRLKTLDDYKKTQADTFGISFDRNPALQNPARATEALHWYDILRHQPIPAKTQYEKTLRIVNGTLSSVETDQLLADLLNFVHNPPPFTINGMPTLGLAELPSFVATFHRLHRDDLAVNLIQDFAHFQNDPSALALLGDLMLQQNQPQLAALYYQLAAPLNLTDASLMYRLGLALSRNPATRPQGQQLLAYYPYLVLGDITQAQQVADAIRQFQGDTAANQYFDNFITHYGNPDPEDLANTRTRAIQSAEAQGNFAAALELQKQALFFPPQLHEEDFSPTLSNLALYHRLRALDAAAHNDLNTLADALTHHLNNAAPDLDLLQKTIPILQSKNPTTAKKILQTALARLTPITQDHPTLQQFQTELKSLQSLQK